MFAKSLRAAALAFAGLLACSGVAQADPLFASFALAPMNAGEIDDARESDFRPQLSSETAVLSAFGQASADDIAHAPLDENGAEAWNDDARPGIAELREQFETRSVPQFQLSRFVTY